MLDLVIKMPLPCGKGGLTVPDKASLRAELQLLFTIAFLYLFNCLNKIHRLHEFQ